jgi:hypothetical protein
MTLQEALKEIQQTKRSRTFIFACRGHMMTAKLAWMKEVYGNRLIKELVEG